MKLYSVMYKVKANDGIHEALVVAADTLEAGDKITQLCGNDFDKIVDVIHISSGMYIVG